MLRSPANTGWEYNSDAVPTQSDEPIVMNLTVPAMTTLSPDTHPDAERVQIELLRQAPAWRKLHMVAQMNSTLRTLALSGLRQRYPDASPDELRRRLADLWLGPELAAKVYGPPPYERVEGKLADV